ncbi:HPr family phosphocarrier protein [Paenibacillus albicereus]|uniref:HPr family phosphocarrier protein n=1 Tax=Paenibacillus albicereus TaxID=2726185 RepID=A0A6H2H302_9BACL|nr:HPr family phosphocarrier protein [Paenibacillus albicereus]QJC54042.1 HPr family phosphocarrier protein [Paenibacillus albicereus]
MSGIGTKEIVDINRAASQFESSIVLHAGGRCIDVKSILGLTVTLVQDECYTLEIHGPDEVDAAVALLDLFAGAGLRVRMR